MIGKIVFVIIFILIFTVSFLFLNQYFSQYLIETNIRENLNTLCEKISSKGVLKKHEYINFLSGLKSYGEYELVISLEKKITEDVGQIITSNEDIIDTDLMRGDILKLIVWDLSKEKALCSSVSYVLANHNKFSSGYEVIQEINNSTNRNYIIEVRNLYQCDYRVYSSDENSIYGDDLIESKNHEAYIYEYARYYKRKIKRLGELERIQYSERKFQE